MTKQQDYLYKTVPFNHQRDIFEASRDLEAFAFLLEQGTGKTKIGIDTAAWLHIRGLIDIVVVLAPNGVHYNWAVNEIPDHMPDYINHTTFVWDSGKSKQAGFKKRFEEFFDATDALKIFTMNIDAIITKQGWEWILRLVTTFRCLLIVDESQGIKTPKAKRTKAVHKLRKYVPFRRLMTGTPITQGPLDIYAQFEFLDPDILGFSSFYSFRNRYAIVIEEKNHSTGKMYKQVVGYQNLEELNGIIAAHSARVLKVDCLDLPDKVYQKLYVQLSATQKALYTKLRDELLVEFEGEELTVQIVLTKMLRLQQITGGFFPSDDPDVPPRLIEQDGPREQALLDVLSPDNGYLGATGKVIIWCRFTPEIIRLRQIIEAKLGKGSVVTYYGATSGEDRMTAVASFQDPDSPVKIFLGQARSGGTGLTLHQATTVVYYSNDFSLGTRLQSEDRAHRIGQKHTVTYIDIVARGTLDERLVKALRDKKKIADMITGDNPKEWI